MAEGKACIKMDSNNTGAKSPELETERQRVLKVLADHKTIITNIVTEYNAVFRNLIFESNDVSDKFVQFKVWRNRYTNSSSQNHTFLMVFSEIDKEFHTLAMTFSNFDKKLIQMSDVMHKYFSQMEIEYKWLQDNVQIANSALTLEQLNSLLIPKEECQHKKSKTDWTFCKIHLVSKPKLDELVDEWKRLRFQARLTNGFRQMEAVIRFVASNGDL